MRQSHEPVFVHEVVALDVLVREAGQQGVEYAEGATACATVHQEPLVHAQRLQFRCVHNQTVQQVIGGNRPVV